MEGQYLEDIIEKEKILIGIYLNRPELFNRMCKLYNMMSSKDGYEKTNTYMRKNYSHIIGGK